MQRIFILLLFAISLSACGQKGGLFLKGSDQQESQQEKPANTTENTDTNKPESGQ